jgi:beta-phosphoglucomutase-like phosphatase (HAD superfamily)
MIELAIFDIAGTLIEDHNEVSDAFLEALRNNSIEVSDAEIKEWKGSAKRQVIAHFVERQFGRCRNLPLIDRTTTSFVSGWRRNSLPVELCRLPELWRLSPCCGPTE